MHLKVYLKYVDYLIFNKLILLEVSIIFIRFFLFSKPDNRQMYCLDITGSRHLRFVFPFKHQIKKKPVFI